MIETLKISQLTGYKTAHGADVYALAMRNQGAASSPVYACWSSETFSKLLASRVTRTLKESDTGLVLCSEGAASGAVAGDHLPWDSAHLGFSCGRIGLLLGSGNYEEDKSAKILMLEAAETSLQERHGVKHLVFRTCTSDLSGVHAAMARGYEYVDGILTFARRCSESRPSGRFADGDLKVRLGRPEDGEALARIAGAAYSFSRYHSDPLIAREAADALHADWLRNSCVGTAADAVVIAEAGGHPIGYVTCAIAKDTRDLPGGSLGTIVQVATAPASRRRGAGRIMTEFALDWFTRQGCAVIEVGTQVQNAVASRLYEDCGFRLAGTSLTLRKWMV